MYQILLLLSPFSRFSLSRKSCYVETLRPGAKDAFRYTSNNLDVPVVIVTSEISPWPLDESCAKRHNDRCKVLDFGLSQWVRVWHWQAQLWDLQGEKARDATGNATFASAPLTLDFFGGLLHTLLWVNQWVNQIAYCQYACLFKCGYPPTRKV